MNETEQDKTPPNEESPDEQRSGGVSPRLDLPVDEHEEEV